LILFLLGDFALSFSIRPDHKTRNQQTTLTSYMAQPQQPTPANRQARVTADGLNVRKTPSLRGTIIGSLNQDDIVDWLDTSDDEKWLKIQKGDLTGWSSHRFLVTLAPDTPTGPADEIIQIASTSAISRFDWANR